MDDESLQLSTRFTLYSIIGGIVIILNSFTILVYATDKEYRKRFILYEILCFAELLNGANFLTAGLGRYTQLSSGTMNTPIQSNECLFGMVWPILMIIGETYPASMTFLLSIERLFAVSCLTEFRRNQHKSLVIFLGFFYPLIMILSASLIVIYAPQTNTNRMCGTTASINPIYGLVQNVTTILLYLISLIISITVYSVITIWRKCSQTEMRYMRTLLVINGISFCFVALPNILLIENNLGSIKFSDLVQGIVYSLYGIQSGGYFFVFYFCRFEFRRRVRGFMCGVLVNRVVSQTTNSGQSRLRKVKKSVIRGKILAVVDGSNEKGKEKKRKQRKSIDVNNH